MPTPTVPPTGTITFLFTDIQGSTTLWEQHPDAMRLALARHDALLRECIEAHDGFLVKTTGDGVHAAFATANLALEAALAAQFALAAEAWELPTPLSVRMALHTGACEERGGDYYGQPLNRAARLMAAGHGGQVLLSEVTQDLVRDSLPPNVALREMGQHRLKDLGRPETVFQLLHPSLPADFPPLKSLDNPALPNNLPQQASSFIGRETQVAEVKALLDKTRLLTLTGAGGAGKTRLSLQVAADLLEGDGDGVWLVELAPLSDLALVPQAVADVLGVQEQAGQPIQRTLVEALKAKRLLLILDNCEHLIAASAALAADLLRFCPGVHLLASSREPLNVAGEQTYRVPSLSLPDPKQKWTVESLSQYEAVRLFIDRAQAVQPAFTVTDANAPAVAQVCSNLDGIPLAIELAAVRVRSLSMEEINTRLGQRFRLLTGGSRVALPRQQTLRALIDWSYDLLTEPEKRLFCRLSVFAGGWTLAAAEGICSGGDIEDWEVVDLLIGLVDKSLVVYEEAVGGGAGRYRLLESIRQYAGDRLAEGGETETVRGRSSAWFLAFAEETEGQLQGPEQASWLGRLEAEHDNLRASLSWYERQPEESESGLRLAGALWRFWEIRGHFSEGRQWLDQALTRTKPDAVGLDAVATPTASAARGKALLGAGNLARSQSDHAAAVALFEESLAIHRRLGAQFGIAACLNNLGLIALNRGDHAAAQAFYEESLALLRLLGNQGGIANLLNNLGLMAFEQGDYAAARVLHEESLAIQRQLGNQGGIAKSLLNLGSVSAEQGDYAAAQTSYEESLALLRALGDLLLIAIALNGLGAVASNLGDYPASWASYAESITIQSQLGDPHGIAYGLEGMADVARGQGRPSRAAQLVGAATTLREKIGSPLPTPGQKELEKTLTTAREALGESAFVAAWDAGRAMTMEEAVEYALANG